MRTIPIDEVVPDVIDIHGLLDFDSFDAVLSPRWLQARGVMVRMPSGVRLRFATDSSRIGIVFHATNVVNPQRGPRPVVFNLGTDGALRTATSMRGNSLIIEPDAPDGFELVLGEEDTVTFENLPSKLTVHELWLPHNAFVELCALKLDGGATLHRALADARPLWIHYDSSVSYCMEAEQPAFTWPAMAARIADTCLQSFGFGGQCHLDQFVARAMCAASADLISIKIGANAVNMPEDAFVTALHSFLAALREERRDVPIVVISPIFCPRVEIGPSPAVANDGCNCATVESFESCSLARASLYKMVHDVLRLCRNAGDTQLHYKDELELLNAESTSLPPLHGLYPDRACDERIALRFAPTLKRLLAQGGD